MYCWWFLLVIPLHFALQSLQPRYELYHFTNYSNVAEKEQKASENEFDFEIFKALIRHSPIFDREWSKARGLKRSKVVVVGQKSKYDVSAT